MSLPLIALTVGDPAGIGPEIAAAALRDRELANIARLVVAGPAATRVAGLPDFDPEAGASWYVTDGPEHWEMGRAQRDCGLATLASLRAGAELASSRVVEALVTGPACKESLHLAGEPVEGQTELLARWAGCTRFEMLAMAGELRVMLLTRHMPLSEAIRRVVPEAIVDRLELLAETLQGLAISAPRLAVAGLNPHAGEEGLYGDEERTRIVPAVEEARARGLSVEGPIPPDTVFVQASEGRWDGVLALYHDQAFIPLKLLSRGRGMTLLAGLPYLRLSPVHGTAFDIAGRGQASAANLLHVLRTAARLAVERRGSS